MLTGTYLTGAFFSQNTTALADSHQRHDNARDDKANRQNARRGGHRGARAYVVTSWSDDEESVVERTTAGAKVSRALCCTPASRIVRLAGSRRFWK